MNKHTPGPWKAEFLPTPYETNRYRITGADFQSVDYSTGKEQFKSFPAFVCDTTGDYGKANARLIAAAPELLEAAKSALMAWSHGDFVSDNGQDKENATKAIYALSCAIAKAKGEA